MPEDSFFDRYSRQMVLPEVGGEGQKRLQNTRVLVVGMGGLGCPIVQYLIGAGVKEIFLYDGDQVSRSDLHRQVLYRTSQIGMDKVQAAKKTLSDLNPEVDVIPIAERLTAERTEEVLSSRHPDVVVEGSDNFQTKFYINDQCVAQNIPVVIGGVLGHEGQVLSVLPEKTACYRCLFEEPPPEDRVVNCSEAGVMGPTASVIGSIQAYETLRLILGFGRPLLNRILSIQLDTMRFRTITFERRSSCRAC